MRLSLLCPNCEEDSEFAIGSPNVNSQGATRLKCPSCRQHFQAIFMWDLEQGRSDAARHRR